MSRLDVVRLGLRPYGEILELQRAVARARIARDVEHDVLLLVEHHPVVTLGRTAKAANLVASPELLAARGVERFEVERGGDVTFHGPGQLVGYPIIDLTGHKKDLHWYLRQLEESLIRALAQWHIPAERNPGLNGSLDRRPEDRVDRRPRARAGSPGTASRSTCRSTSRTSTSWCRAASPAS